MDIVWTPSTFRTEIVVVMVEVLSLGQHVKDGIMLPKIFTDGHRNREWEIPGIRYVTSIYLPLVHAEDLHAKVVSEQRGNVEGAQQGGREATWNEWEGSWKPC